MSADAPLEATLRSVEPAARLVSERQLRRVLRTVRESGRPVGSNPALPYWVDGVAVRAADVDVPDADRPRLLLAVDPDDRMIAHRPRPEQLRVYWRALFQAAVMAAIDARLADGTLTAAGSSVGTTARNVTPLPEKSRCISARVVA